jgi:hypothetical protein
VASNILYDGKCFVCSGKGRIDQVEQPFGDGANDAVPGDREYP